MTEYRAYPIGNDGHFMHPTVISSVNDGEAISEAKKLLNGRAIEVWAGSRMVARLDHANRDCQASEQHAP